MAEAVPVRRHRFEELLAKELIKKGMRGEWQELVQYFYGWFEEVRHATIIQTGDTLLHLAVSSRVESNVRMLIGRVSKDYGRAILEIGNNWGDTPLHLAAAFGMGDVCFHMAMLCPELVTEARNKLGETPLFKAARHGQKEAFAAMQRAAPDACSSCNDLAFCRNFAGDSILHVALVGEHYGT